MTTPSLTELFTPYFDNLTDPRIDRSKRHSLLNLIVIALCATLGGANGWADIERFGEAKIDFFRDFLDLPQDIPSHDTFGRVFARLDPAVLLDAIRSWLAALQRTVDRELVAIDGKTLDAVRRRLGILGLLPGAELCGCATSLPEDGAGRPWSQGNSRVLCGRCACGLVAARSLARLTQPGDGL
jgi:hypothetical protein